MDVEKLELNKRNLKLDQSLELFKFNQLYILNHNRLASAHLYILYRIKSF